MRHVLDQEVEGLNLSTTSFGGLEKRRLRLGQLEKRRLGQLKKRRTKAKQRRGGREEEAESGTKIGPENS